MARLSSLDRECLALGFEEEFWSMKHLYSPSDASKLREKEVSSVENRLATAGVGFGTGWEEVEGLSMWTGRGVSNTGGGQWQPETGSQGWQDREVMVLRTYFWGLWVGKGR